MVRLLEILRLGLWMILIWWSFLMQQGCTTTDVSKGLLREYPLSLNNPNAICLPNYCDGTLLNSRKMIEDSKKS